MDIRFLSLSNKFCHRPTKIFSLRLWTTYVYPLQPLLSVHLDVANSGMQPKGGVQPIANIDRNFSCGSNYLTLSRG